MSDLYKNKYRTQSARAQWWDYSLDAAYFITICIQTREHFFGEIEDGKMQLSEIGKIAETYWLEIPQHFPFVHLDVFVVMPNHVHGIVIINKSGIEIGAPTGRNADEGNSAPVETQDFASLQLQKSNILTKPTNQFGPQSRNLASIIRGFKIGVTKSARNIHADFTWQPRYHDHIIRNADSYQRIADYILHNPQKWSEDKFYTK